MHLSPNARWQNPLSQGQTLQIIATGHFYRLLPIAVVDEVVAVILSTAFLYKTDEMPSFDKLKKDNETTLWDGRSKCYSLEDADVWAKIVCVYPGQSDHVISSVQRQWTPEISG